MSKLDFVQLGSNSLHWKPLFTAFQTLGATTTLNALPSNLTIPVAVAGDGSHNPVAVFDNRKERITTALLAFAVTAANNTKVAFDLIGFSQIDFNTGLYIPTKFFLGEAQGGNINVSTALSEATAFLCDNFSVKTFASPYVNYIEPTDDLTAATIVVDIRGMDFLMLRMAQGAATAATKAQAWIGSN